MAGLSLEFRGAVVALVQASAERVVFEAESFAPPGAVIQLNSSRLGAFEAKVRACRRVGAQGSFRIEARFRNLTRAQRQALDPLAPDG